MNQLVETKKLSLAEAANLPLGFELTEEMIDESIQQGLRPILEKHGLWKPVEAVGSSGSLKKTVESK